MYLGLQILRIINTFISSLLDIGKVIVMALLRDIRRKLLWFSLLLFLLLAFSVAVSPVLALVSSIKVTIKNTGVVHVEIVGEVEEGLNEVLLPIQPIPISLEVYVNDTLIPSILVNNSIYIPSPGKGLLTIKYVANTTTVDGKSVLTIIGSQELALTIEPGVVLLTIPDNIVKTYYENGNLVIVFHGPTMIEYTITTLTTTPTLTSPPPKETVHKLVPQFPLEYIAVVSIVLVVIVLTIIAKVKKGRKHRISEEEITIIELDETDKRILEELRAAGGIAFQRELQKKLNIPKATLWRHVKRLERLGYIEIRKEGRASKLILKRKK